MNAFIKVALTHAILAQFYVQAIEPVSCPVFNGVQVMCNGCQYCPDGSLCSNCILVNPQVGDSTCTPPFSVPPNVRYITISEREKRVIQKEQGWVARPYDTPDSYVDIQQLYGILKPSPYAGVPFVPLYNFSFVSASGLIGSGVVASEVSLFNSQSNLNRLRFSTQLLPSLTTALATNGNLQSPTLSTFSAIYASLPSKPATYQFYDSDIAFGQTRLTVQTFLLKRVNAITDITFDINTINGLNILLSGKSISQVIQFQRLFIEDFTTLGITSADGSPGALVEAPIILYYNTDDNYFTPIAIHFTINNHNTYSPLDSHADWLAAKATTNSVSTIVTGSSTIKLVAEQSFVDEHPVYNFIKKATSTQYGIISAGITSLLSDGGAFDRLSVLSGKSFRNHFGPLLSHQLNFTQTYVDIDMKIRGLENLPTNYYYQDSYQLYQTIYTYINDYLSTFYTDIEILRNDNEIRRFITKLSNPDMPTYIKGFPSEVTSLDDIVKIVTQIVWLTGVKHHAVNSNAVPDILIVYPHSPIRLTAGCIPSQKGILTDTTFVQNCLLSYGPANSNFFTSVYAFSEAFRLHNLESSQLLANGYIFLDNTCNSDAYSRFVSRLNNIGKAIQYRNTIISTQNKIPVFSSLDPRNLPFSATI